MQTVDKAPKFIEGVFVKELKNRFLCEVLVNGESTVCYVPSSCHLSKRCCLFLLKLQIHAQNMRCLLFHLREVI